MRWTPCGPRARRGMRPSAIRLKSSSDGATLDLVMLRRATPRWRRASAGASVPSDGSLLGGAHQGHRVPRRGVRARGGESRRAPRLPRFPGRHLDRRRRFSPALTHPPPATPSAFASRRTASFSSTSSPRSGAPASRSTPQASSSRSAAAPATSSRPPRSCTSPPAVPPPRAPPRPPSTPRTSTPTRSRPRARRSRRTASSRATTTTTPRRPPPAASERTASGAIS